MRNVIDWCDRHIVATYVLITFLLTSIIFVLLFVFAPPHSQTAAAKPVKTPTPTVSCATGYSSDYKYGVKECKVKLKDGRTVTCVNLNKGTSCDWRHVK